MYTLTTAAVTHPGRVRRTNEDSLAVTPRVVAVADGLGGHASGEVASRLAVAAVRALDDGADDTSELTPDDVSGAVRAANASIVDDARVHRARLGMGTTLTGLALVTAGGSEHCLVFNVGDSRVYRRAEGRLTRVTVDHSEVQELQDAGHISAADAARHPRRNVVTRCLGSVPAPEPDLWLFPPAEQERFLVCSDGLTNELTDDEIEAVLAAHPTPGPAASALLERALAAGGRDNIAVIVVDLKGGADPGAAYAETAPRARITERS